MKKGIKILLGALILLLLACIGLFIWQRDNINALRYSVTMTPEEIQAQIDTNQKTMRDTMEQYQIPQEELSEETMDQILSGELNLQEAVKDFLHRDLTGDNPLPSLNSSSDTDKGDQSTSKPDDTTSEKEDSEPQTQEESPASSDARIQEDLAALYVLQAVYEGRLEAMVQEAIAEYSAGGRSREDIESAKMGQIIALEQECDQQIYAIIADIREQLKATGQDNALANKVETYYLSQKNMKKAQYIQQYRS